MCVGIITTNLFTTTIMNLAILFVIVAVFIGQNQATFDIMYGTTPFLINYNHPAIIDQYEPMQHNGLTYYRRIYGYRPKTYYPKRIYKQRPYEKIVYIPNYGPYF